MSDCAQLLEITTYHWPNGRTVLRVLGDLDAQTAPRLFDTVVDLDLHAGEHLAMDLEDVTFLDAVGASVLLACESSTMEHACSFCVTAVSLQARSVLELLGLDRLLDEPALVDRGGSSSTAGSAATDALRIRTRTCSDGRTAMRLIGPLDGPGASVLMEEIPRRSTGLGRQLVLDLEDVTILEPAGVNALAYAEAFMRARGGQLTIASSNSTVSAGLVYAGLERLLVPDRMPLAPTQAG